MSNSSEAARQELVDKRPQAGSGRIGSEWVRLKKRVKRACREREETVSHRLTPRSTPRSTLTDSRQQLPTRRRRRPLGRTATPSSARRPPAQEKHTAPVSGRHRSRCRSGRSSFDPHLPDPTEGVLRPPSSVLGPPSSVLGPDLRDVPDNELLAGCRRGPLDDGLPAGVRHNLKEKNAPPRGDEGPF